MRFILCFFLVLGICACRHYNDQAATVGQPAISSEHLAEVNKKMVSEESALIDSFISRHKFNMRKSGTGLRYELIHTGKGQHLPKLHDEVTVAYQEFLLNGKLIYHTDSIHDSTFGLGEGSETNGLEEALMLMKEGDSSRVVVPSHLAFGLSGDNNKIPPGTPLFYEVILKKIKR